MDMAVFGACLGLLPDCSSSTRNVNAHGFPEADLNEAASRQTLSRVWQHLKVLRAIARCRTAALGGHLDECTDSVRPSPTTAAGTGTAQSVRPTLATVGST